VWLTASTSPAGQNDSMADHLAGLPAMSRTLDLYPYGRYHDCSRCFFWSCSSGSGPEGTG
jgi:hypothetical protein